MARCKYGKLKHKVGRRVCKLKRTRSGGSWAKIAKHAAAAQRKAEKAWRNRPIASDYGRYKSRRKSRR